MGCGGEVTTVMVCKVIMVLVGRVIMVVVVVK